MNGTHPGLEKIVHVFERLFYGGALDYLGHQIKFFWIRLSVQVEKPLRRFLCVVHSVEDEYHGLFKYEHLHSLCFRCGCLGNL